MNRNRDLEGWVSASDIGRAEFCPKYLEHRQRGVRVGKHAIAKRKIGEMGHEDLNKSVSDSRCFIASHLYGATDERTECLRVFRDEKLLGNLPGRTLIRVYYAISPWLVALCRAFPVLDGLLKPLIDRCVSTARERKEKWQQS